MNEKTLNLGRYKEKESDKYWECTGFGCDNGVNFYHMRPIEDKYQDYKLTKDEIESRFEYKPFQKPVFKIEKIEPRHPVKINFQCPECGSLLKLKGGAILTEPLQYEHICSNKDCHYHTCITSIRSGMFALVTNEQEKHINDGTYSVFKHGEIIEISEKETYFCH